MLVLTRKIGESLAINENVRITVLEVKGKTVRLGIEAPATSKYIGRKFWLKFWKKTNRPHLPEHLIPPRWADGPRTNCNHEIPIHTFRRI